MFILNLGKIEACAMTQSKLIKKKKKITKTDKTQKDEIQSVASRPTTPVDKKVEAENNLRQMIREAHRIHKIHMLRSSRGFVGRTVSVEKPYINQTYNAKYETNIGGRRLDKLRRETGEWVPPQTKVICGSAECSRSDLSKKNSLADRRNRKEKLTRSGESPARAKEGGSRRRGSSTLLSGQKESPETPPQSRGVRDVKIKRQRFDRPNMKIKDYQVGKPPFVSLELLDRMKVHESDLYVPQRRIQRRRVEREGNLSQNSEETSPGDSAKKLQTRRTGERMRKKKESSKAREGEGKEQPPQESGEVRKRRTRLTRKTAVAHSGLIPTSRESTEDEIDRTRKAKSAVDRSKLSDSDSIRSAMNAAGDPFSSNTSHSYMSSDSDISKIDRKFMQILEAVTQNNLRINFDDNKGQPADQERTAPENGKSKEASEKALQDKEPNESDDSIQLGQKILRRIASLERKLERSAVKKESEPEKKEAKVADSGDNAEATQNSGPVVEELWIKQNSSRSEQSATSMLDTENKQKADFALSSLDKPKKVVASEAEKVDQSREATKEEPRKDEKVANEAERQQTPRVIVMRLDAGLEQPKIAPKEAPTEATVKPKEVPMKKASLKNVASTSTSKTKVEKTEAKKSATKIELTSKPLETWSIIRRLEKAFQTLGLDLDDLEDSDNDGTSKRNPPMKKLGSGGKEKRSRSKAPETGQVAVASKKPVAGRRTDVPDDSGDKYGVESNGCGDKDAEQVKTKRKLDDLVKMTRERRLRERNDRQAYYASVYLRVPQKGEMGYDAEGLSEGELSEALKTTLSKRKFTDRRVEQFPDNRISWKKSRLTISNPVENCGGKSPKQHSRRLKDIDGLDIDLPRRKRGSEYSIADSCSISSLSVEDDLGSRKLKMEPADLGFAKHLSLKDQLKLVSSGKGDATPENLSRTKLREAVVESRKGRPPPAFGLLPPSAYNNHEILKLQMETDELELKQIRERHRQIISEIKSSLKEIKDQHELFTELQNQTKRFNMDCRAKRKLMASYLRDVEESYERRRARYPIRENQTKRTRPTSTESYSWSRRKKMKLREKLSDCEMDLLRWKKLREDLPRSRNSCESVASVRGVSSMSEASSVGVDPGSGDNHSSDTGRESVDARRFHRYEEEEKRRRKAGVRGLKRAEGGSQTSLPSYLSKLLERLNRLILTEKNGLENLVVKASGSSNSSSCADRGRTSCPPKCPAKCSSCKNTKPQRSKAEEATRLVTEGCKASSSNATGSGPQRHHKVKSPGNKKGSREKGSAEDSGGACVLSRSGNRTQGDPGGGPPSVARPESKCDPSESAACRDGHCGHAQWQDRHTKGDQRPKEFLLKSSENPRSPRKRTQEEEEAYLRKIELERILRMNEGNLLRPNRHSLDPDSHTMNYENFLNGKGRHQSLICQRQQSIIIDHNRGEENEESQTVLGHASRHSGGRSSDRKLAHEYYLKGERRSESNYWKHRDLWKSIGSNYSGTDVPITYCAVSLNVPDRTIISKDMHCQTENLDDSDDPCDISLLDDSGSGNSFNL